MGWAIPRRLCPYTRVVCGVGLVSSPSNREAMITVGNAIGYALAGAYKRGLMFCIQSFVTNEHCPLKD